ncbi:MAG: DNA helicase [Spirochaetales bacterium]|nr:MAG: DNA helicase [Spirochaetales bacterium]
MWNAAGAGWTAARILKALAGWSRYAVPENVITQIQDILSRWGKIRLLNEPELSGKAAPAEQSGSESWLRLEIDSPEITEELKARKAFAKWLIPDGQGFRVRLINRGTVKAELIRIGYPVLDMVPLKDGAPLEIALKKQLDDTTPFKIRDYQQEAAAAFAGTGAPGTGFGTVVMPCGSGKTIVGMAVMEQMATQTLILTTNVAAVHQWRSELLHKTHLQPDQITEYTGEHKGIAPVTIATYQVLTWRKDKNSPYPHFDLLRKHPWGLIIYDEVHLLPAPVFRVTAEIQAIRRLGLTATLIREDGAERDVFSLVGPKRFDVPWKQLEASGWIAEARCREIRINLPPETRIPYAMADRRRKVRIAAENSRKIAIARELAENHKEDHILIIGQYIKQLEEMASHLKVPLITGKTPNQERERIYQNFREGKDRIIVVSKVANFAIDLPDASVAIQLSGSFGSRQEEAQRLGRILRPKKRDSWFFSLVSRGTVEEEFSANRQRFLTEQGYRYSIDIWDEL